MLIGPLSANHLRGLEEVLQEKKLSFKVFHSEENLDDRQREELARPYRVNPAYEGRWEHLYLELDPAAAEAVRDQLERLGFLAQATGEELSSNDEFVCPKCESTSNRPGVCGKDGTAFVPFSEFVKISGNRTDRGILKLAGIFLFAAGLLIAVMYLSE